MSKKKKEISMEYDYLRSSSSQDFTGLIPGGTVEESEREDYEELYPFYPTVPKNTKKTK